MKILQTIIIFTVLIFISQTSDSQQLRENEVVVIKGERFLLHQVRTGETLFSLSRDFKIDRALLIKNNPGIEDGLKIGEIVKIPYRENIIVENQASQTKKGDPERFELHTITSRSETPYFISRQYGITVEEIYAYNPEINKFKKGTTLRIPVWNTRTDKKIYVPETMSETETGSPEGDRAGEVTGYFEHIIESGETLWGITRKYNVTENELKTLNPLLETGFPAGAVIKIPVEKTEIVEVKPANSDVFLKHVVQGGETLYGLAAKYHLNITEIRKFNPALETRNIVRGETVLIPRKSEPEMIELTAEKEDDAAQVLSDYYHVEVDAKPLVMVPESCKPQAFGRTSYATYNVALFLPLFVEANDTLNKKTEILETADSIGLTGNDIADPDTLIEEPKKEDSFVGFYRNSENYLQFYEGVLLAVDSMKREGMRINLNVFDTQQSADSIRKFIYAEDFLETDLILGPVFPNVQKEVASIAAKNRIPIVSPLTAESVELQRNPYYYQVNPNRDYMVVKTAEMVAEEYFNSNFIVFKTSNYFGSPEEKLVNLIQEKLYNSGLMGKPDGVRFSIYDFQNEGPNGLRSILSREKENVIYIPSSDEGELSVGISNINNLANEFSITLIGNNRFQQYESIQLDHFYNLKLEYIAPYWTDYEKQSTVTFIEKFKSNFYTEPNNFGMQGYDVAFYFLNALKNYGKDFRDCLPYLQVDLVQGNYHFQKVSPLGGYMNHGVSVIAYERDYDVVRKRLEGQLNLANK